MAKSLIDQIEEVLGRKLEEVLDRKLDEKLDQKLDEKFGVFMEHMDDKFDSLAEAVQANLEIVSKLPSRDEFNELKAEVSTIRFAVTDTNRELHGL